MSRTTDVKHNITCPVCDEGIAYIGNVDKAKIIESDRIQADSVTVLCNEAFYTTDGRHLAVEVLVTCPSCNSSIKTTNATRIIE
ncbi:hypothetical protein [Bacillus cereus]|uniref:hypothetical protein n=1 Tax=Bacillus cereus TaxID=1396 RepID=UPI003D171C0C